MKLLLTILTVAVLGLTYLSGFNKGFNRGYQVALQLDPSCKTYGK